MWKNLKIKRFSTMNFYELPRFTYYYCEEPMCFYYRTVRYVYEPCSKNHMFLKVSNSISIMKVQAGIRSGIYCLDIHNSNLWIYIGIYSNPNVKLVNCSYKLVFGQLEVGDYFFIKHNNEQYIKIDNDRLKVLNSTSVESVSQGVEEFCDLDTLVTHIPTDYINHKETKYDFS